MKRALVFIVLAVLLFQAFAGLEIPDVKRMEKETSIEAMPTDNFPQGAEQLTRGTVNESDALGGSWFDDFEDGDGIQWMDNASVVGGKVRMGDNEAVPDNNCLGLWHFNNGNGDIAINASGNGSNGTIHGANWTEGVMGKALEFDGEDDYVDINRINSNFSVPSEGTLIAWIYRTFENSIDHKASIISLNMNGDNNIYLQYEHDNDYWYFKYKAGGTLKVIQLDPNIIPKNTWTCLSMSWSENNNELKAYINGIKEGPTENNLGTWSGGSLTSSEIGALGGNDVFKGIIDEVAIYNRSLPAWEISERAKRYRNESYVTSKPIDLPQDVHWDTLSLDKYEPANTYLNVSVLDANNNLVIPGYDNLTGRNIDISDIDEMGVNSIRLRAWFEGNGNDTPVLGSWGVEWREENSWRDSFSGDGKSTFYNQSAGAYLNGSAQFAYNKIVAENNTTALWHFDEGEGGILYDSSPNGNNGTIHGANWTDGGMGTGLEFDGTDDHVSVGASTSLDYSMADNFSAEMWIWINSSADHCLLLKRFTGNNQLHWNFSIFANGSLFFGLDRFTTGGWSKHFAPPGLIITEKWHHVAFTKRGQNPGIVSLYIDGLEVLSESIGPNPQGVTAADGAMYVGKHYDHEQFLDGTIDEVAIYNRGLTAPEIYNHSQRYHTSATVLSEPISLPQYHSWDKLVINKAEPFNHFINVSIIDNATNGTVDNFGNILNDGVIDISSIDFHNNTTIRLKAAFDGNGSDTPLLHSWGLNWTNHLPVLGAPTYVNSVNRTETVNISIPASDHEENITVLVFEREYKLHSSGLWVINYISNFHFSSDHYFLNFTPPSNAPIGSYDFRFRLTDSVGATDGWQYYNNSIEVMNNQLTHDGMNLSAEEVYRTKSVNITVLNISDVEKDFVDIVKTIQYTPNGTEEWNDTFISVVRRGDNATFVFTPDNTASLGSYDLRALLNDSDGELEVRYPGQILVKNNLPTILPGLESISLEANSSLEINLTPYGDDTENAIPELNWTYNASSVDTSFISDISIINSTLNITVIKGGLTSIELILTDTDSGSASKAISINISETSLPETGELGGYVLDVDKIGIPGAKVMVGIYTDAMEQKTNGGNLTNVTVRTWVNLTADTDANGSFLITGIAPGKWNVTVTATGYIKHTEEMMFTTDLLKKNITLNAPPTPTYDVIVGPILDGNGEPVMGATVSFSLDLTRALKQYSATTNVSGFAKYTLPEKSIPMGTAFTATKDGITINWAQGEVIPPFEAEVTGFEISLGPFLSLNDTPLAGVEVIVVHNNVTYNGTTDGEGNVILKNFPNSSLPNGTNITAKYDNQTYEYTWDPANIPKFTVGEEIKAPKKEEEADNTMLYVIIAVVVIIIIAVVLFLIMKKKKPEEIPSKEETTTEGAEPPAGIPPASETADGLSEVPPEMAMQEMMMPPMPESMDALPPPADFPPMDDGGGLRPPSYEELELLDEGDYDELFEEVPFEEVDAVELDEYFDEMRFEEVFEEIYGGEFVEEGFD